MWNHFLAIIAPRSTLIHNCSIYKGLTYGLISNSVGHLDLVNLGVGNLSRKKENFQFNFPLLCGYIQTWKKSRK